MYTKRKIHQKVDFSNSVREDSILSFTPSRCFSRLLESRFFTFLNTSISFECSSTLKCWSHCLIFEDKRSSKSKLDSIRLSCQSTTSNSDFSVESFVKIFIHHEEWSQCVIEHISISTKVFFERYFVTISFGYSKLSRTILEKLNDSR